MQRLHLGFRIGKADIVELERAVELRFLQIGFVNIHLHRLLHEFLQGAESRLGAMDAGDQPRKLAHRRDTAPQQHGHGDQPAHGQRSILDQIDAVDDDGNRGHLLYKIGKRAHRGGHQFCLDAPACDLSRRILPFFLVSGLHIVGAHRLR